MTTAHMSDLSITNISDASLDSISPEPDPTTRYEISNWLEQEQAAKVRGVIQDIRERKKYALCIFVLVATWLAAMIAILLFEGFAMRSFKLSDGAIIAVVTTTTGGVVGLLVLVVKYLFPAK